MSPACHFGCGRKIRRTLSHFRLSAARYFLIFTGFKGFKLFAAVPTSASCHLWKGISVVPANLAQYQIMGATQGTFDRSLEGQQPPGWLWCCVLLSRWDVVERGEGERGPILARGELLAQLGRIACILRSINFSPRGGL